MSMRGTKARKRRRVPPVQNCGNVGCGHTWRGWSTSCPRCAPTAGQPDASGETLREFRKRVIDPERNAS